MAGFMWLGKGVSGRHLSTQLTTLGFHGRRAWDRCSKVVGWPLAPQELYCVESGVWFLRMHYE